MIIVGCPVKFGQHFIQFSPFSGSRKTPAISKEAADKEYLKIQLNLAHTKITSQDSSLKKQEETIAFLSVRVSLLELNINNQMRSQYFPPVQPTSHAPPLAPAVQAGASSFSSTAVPAPTQPPPFVPEPSAQSSGTTPLNTSAEYDILFQLSRKMEVVLTELDLSKKRQARCKQTGLILQSVLHHSSSLNSQPSQSTSEEVSTASHPSGQPNEASTVPKKVSRHSQTTGSSSNQPGNTRQPRPLFPPPSPWLNGQFPSCPVRLLPPPQVSQPLPVPRTRQKARFSQASEQTPGVGHNSGNVSLITELYTGSVSFGPAIVPGVQPLPKNSDSLNFFFKLFKLLSPS